MELVPLDFLQSGERAEIFDIDGDSSDIHRLAELGIRKGATILMVQAGSPCILTVDQQRFTLRLDPEVTVLVQPAI